MRSVGRYLQSRMLTGAALILAGAGLVIYLVVARSLDRQFDRNLEDRIQALGSILFQVEDEVSFEFSDELMPEYTAEDTPSYFELSFPGGGLLEASESLAGGALECPEAPGPGVRCWFDTLPDGRPGRYASQVVEVHHVFPEEGPGRPTAKRVAIVIARGTEPLLATKRAVVVQSIVALLVILALLALLCRVAVGRGLEPTRRLAGALDGIRMDDLPAGLALGQLPTELEPMQRKADELIQRVRQAIERERRTTADIAHELRTPISEVLTVSEVALRGSENGGEGDETLRTIRDIASRMGRSVSTLLRLAKLEKEGGSFQRVGVEVGKVAAELLAQHATRIRVQGLEVVNHVPADAVVVGDPDAVRIILSNLIGNAVTYSPAGEEVRIALDHKRLSWRLTVENATRDLDAQDVQVLTEPFWRKDRARSDRDRFGLGLALSAALAAETGLFLDFELDGERLRAVLEGEGSSATRNGSTQPS